MVVDRKYLITQLRRCKNCRLLFRTPTDKPNFNASFYERNYRQGFTTELPSDEALSEMTRSCFAGSEKDYSYYIDVLTQLLPRGASVFDYGCSWGYGSYQIARAGFEVAAYEVAPTRRAYARQKLGVKTADSIDSAASQLAGQFDCFFSAHVIEHVPSPSAAFRHAMRLLKRGGVFVSFTPNGCQERRQISPEWHWAWGEVHPNLIDDDFLDTSFKLSPRAIGVSPVKTVSLPETPSMTRLNKLDSGELFFAARKTGEAWG